VARLAAHFSGISYSFTAHAKDIFHDEVDTEDLRKKIRDASSVITVSDYNVEYLKEKYGPVSDKVTRIYNGLDLGRFPFKNPFERKPLIIAVGRLVEKKGFADLIDACDILTRSIGDFNCRIIGIGPLEGELREKIKSLGLGNIMEMTGPRPQNEIIRLMQEASVLVAPCVIGTDGNRDGLPTVILEAMALGTPVVSTDVTGIPEVVKNEESGLLVPQHDPKTLALVIERLIKDADLRRKLSINARKLMERDFDVHTNSVLLRKNCYYPEGKDLKFAGEIL
jgi:glycosyltransferase involved in cell wall biosynthesis